MPDQTVLEGGTVTSLMPIFPQWLGDRAFTTKHGLEYPYIVGEMARGIATPAMVIAAAKAGFLGFFGSAGLTLDEIEKAVGRIEEQLSPTLASWGANLIHTPQQPGYERAVIDLFIARGVDRVSASAFMKLTPEIVRYTASGLARAPDGQILRQRHVFAKVSRAEVAEQFMAPPPKPMLQALVAAGDITEAEADLAISIPVAAEITAEADSGGHTDNRAASVLFPSLLAARARVAKRFGIDAHEIRIGLAGGIATPHAVAAAFQMGAAYVLTGSINQAALESGLSPAGREMLSTAGPADVAMAPAADMFEQGVKVQVLKRGTLFAMRGERLFNLYRSGAAYEDLSAKDKSWIEMTLGEPFETAWQATREYLITAHPKEAERGDRDGNKRFALVARRYLFSAAQWAREGDAARRADYQIWCGPAMGAFNEWVAGSFLEPVENRSVAQIGWNLMEGAAILMDAARRRASGEAIPPTNFDISPRRFAPREA